MSSAQIQILKFLQEELTNILMLRLQSSNKVKRRFLEKKVKKLQKDVVSILSINSVDNIFRDRVLAIQHECRKF
jgi:hypothetical protein